MEIMTSIALPVVRGPVPLCSSLVALDLLCGGSLIAGVGPGSSRADYEAVGVPFDQRWARFDEALRVMRGLLGGEPVDEPLRFYSSPSTWSWADSSFRRRVPVWVGSWGSAPGLRRVARRADGWLASSYNTDPTTFRDSLETLLAAGAGGRTDREAGVRRPAARPELTGHARPCSAVLGRRWCPSTWRCCDVLCSTSKIFGPYACSGASPMISWLSSPRRAPRSA